MTIEVENQDGSDLAILTIKGEFWGGNEWAVHEKIKELIDEEKTRIVLDMSRVKRVNSTGIGALVASLTTLRGAGGDMKLAGANRNIADHLGLLNLYTVIEMFETPEEAVASYEK
jgi:anti-sigma B factor antagonist